MSKETEEIVGIGLLVLFFLFFISKNNGGSSNSAVQLAQINAATNLGYADAASTAISAVAGAFN